MSASHALAFFVGWILGGAVMWAHFKINKLIRTREEWERHR